jgi:23S rRNA (uracil1939-C5)-methyltransferase
MAHGDRPLIDQLLREVTTVRGVFAHGPHWAWQRGDLSISVRPLESGPPIAVPATAFIQANPAANQALVGAMLAAAAPAKTDRVLELHAGSGNFAVALAPRVATLRAVERHRGAARALGTTVRSRGWKHVAVIAADAAQELETLAERVAALDGVAGFDLVVADPPRTGMAAEAALLARLKPPRLVYISCDLATFARDARILLAAGYRLSGVQPIDLFPQTFHIELVASFERAG